MNTISGIIPLIKLQATDVKKATNNYKKAQF